MSPVDTDLGWRVLRLAASEWATPDRLRSAVAELLEQPDPVTASGVVRTLESAAGRALAGGDDVRRVARALEALGARLLVVGEQGYPPRLAQAWPELGAPLWLFAWCAGAGPDGEASGESWYELPSGPAVAVVGTRRPTLDGVATAERLGRGLAAAGAVTVSGMALGIDQAAHRGALGAGGQAIGVLGTGFGVDYPSGSRRLREAVAEAGGLLTEYLPGVPPRPRHFLWRNRIVAGLADVTVVVEGRERSGALATARLAAAQGREVLAVPGSLNVPTSQGPLALMRDGVRPLTCVEDVLELLGLSCGDAADPSARGSSPGPRPALGPDGERVLGLLGAVPVSVDRLVAATGLPVPAVLATVGRLVALGLASPASEGYVRQRLP